MTNLCIVRCPRDYHKMVWTAVSMINEIEGRQLLFRLVHLGGKQILVLALTTRRWVTCTVSSMMQEACARVRRRPSPIRSSSNRAFNCSRPPASLVRARRAMSSSRRWTQRKGIPDFSGRSLHNVHRSGSSSRRRKRLWPRKRLGQRCMLIVTKAEADRCCRPAASLVFLDPHFFC